MAIAAIDILIGAVLLYDEHFNAGRQQVIDLIGTQLIKGQELPTHGLMVRALAMADHKLGIMNDRP